MAQRPASMTELPTGFKEGEANSTHRESCGYSGSRPTARVRPVRQFPPMGRHDWPLASQVGDGRP